MTTELNTLGLMEAATVTLSTGSTASGYSLNSMVDFNPDIYWKSGASANPVIDIDLGEAKTADWFGLWIPNYGDTSMYSGGGKGVIVYSDDNDDGNYSATTARCSAYTLGSLTSPLIVFASPTTATKRYWRFSFVNVSSDAIQISHLFLARKRAPTQAHNWPQNDVDTFANRTVDAPGGRRYVQGINRNRFQRYSRDWLLSGTTDFEAIRDAFRDSCGRRFPLIHREDSTYRFSYIDQDTFDHNQINYQLYGVHMDFMELPYVDYGETY